MLYQITRGLSVLYLINGHNRRNRSWLPANGATHVAPLLPVALGRLQRAEGAGRGVVAAVALAPAAGALATGMGNGDGIIIYLVIKFVG